MATSKTSTTTVGKNISSLPTSTIQKAVGAKSDGIYGANTTASVKAFQTANGLVADGIVGPKTQAAILASQNKTGTTNSGMSSISGAGTTGGSTGGSSLVNGQAGIMQGTGADKSKANATGAKIDATVNGATGVYGTPVKDQTGNIIGYEKYDTKTGKPLENPADKKETPVPEGNIKDSLGNTYNSSMPKNLTYQLPALTNDKKWVFDSSGKPFEMDASGKVTTNTVAEQEYNINVRGNKAIEENNTMLDSLKANISAAHQVIIDSIKQKAQEQKTAMEDLNKRYLGAKTIAGFRTGSTEYTPEIAMGILKNEEEEGIRRIKEIDDKMVLALAEAVSAKNDKDLAVAEKKFNDYTKLQKEKETAIIDQYKMYLDNQKYIADTKKALETETRAKEDQGIQKMKAGADAYLKAYNTSKDKNGYVQSIATQLGLSPEIVLGQILNAQPKVKTTTSGGKQTSTEIKADAIGSMATSMESIAGGDGFIDPNKWIEARKAWIAKGLNDADFLKNFKQYLNPESYKLIPEFAPKKKTTSSRPS